MPVHPTGRSSTPLIELFSSIQGEGMQVGLRQIFLRFAGCNLNCAYCDTQFEAPPSCRIEKRPGSSITRDVANPVGFDVVRDRIATWQRDYPGLHHSLSITGGEPLLHGALLREWLPDLSTLIPIHLETNGTLADTLEPLMPFLHHVAMDIKLVSTSGEPTRWEEHRRFLSIAKEVSAEVKLVVDHTTSDEEIRTACALVAEIAPEVPVILQPRTGGDHLPAIASSQLIHLDTLARSIHTNIRTIPQTHVFLSIA